MTISHLAQGLATPADVSTQSAAATSHNPDPATSVELKFPALEPTDPEGKTASLREPNKRRDVRDKFTPGQIVVALQASGGLFRAAGRRLGCSPTTLANYVRRHDDIRRAKQQIDEEILDFAEMSLQQRMVDDTHPAVQLRAIIYFLSKRGGSRGYAPQKLVAYTSNRSPRQARSEPPATFAWSRLTENERGIAAVMLAKAARPEDI